MPVPAVFRSSVAARAPVLLALAVLLVAAAGLVAPAPAAADAPAVRPVGVAPAAFGDDEVPLGEGDLGRPVRKVPAPAGRAGRAGTVGAGTGQRSVLVLRTYYDGEGWPALTDPEMSFYTVPEVQARVTGSSTSARAMYEAQSGGTVSLRGLSGPDADVSDWLHFAGPLPRKNGQCDSSAVAGTVLGAADERGIPWESYDHVVILFPYLPPSQCAWAGRAQVGGRVIWINGFLSQKIRDDVVDGAVIAHEVGHNLGLAHASSLACTQPGSDPATAVLTSTGCSLPVSASGYPSGSAAATLEYGDPFDMMGTVGYAFAWRGSELLSTWHRAQALELPAAGQQVATVAGSYTLSAASEPAGTRLIRIPRGTDPSLPELALEYRPAGSVFDAWGLEPGFSPMAGGVLVRLVPTITSSARSFLLDATPETRQSETGGSAPGSDFYDGFKAAWGDAALRAGRTLVDGPSGLRITVTAATATSASVTLSGGPLAPTAAPTPTPAAAASTPAPIAMPTPTGAPAPAVVATTTPRPSVTPTPMPRPAPRLVSPAPGRSGVIRLPSTRTVVVSFPGAGRVTASIGTRWSSTRSGSRVSFTLPRSAVARGTVQLRATRGALATPELAALRVRRGVLTFGAP
ncbi:MAG: hypothetical protein PGN13_04605 [Patulibacter minatonensis]